MKAPHERRASSSHSESLEMQERRASIDEEQQERLLPNGNVATTKKVEPDDEWDWQTIRAICLSILTTISVFFIMVVYTKLVIVRKGGNAVQETEQRGFRGPDSNYVLDPNWDFNSAPKVRQYNWTILNIVRNPDGVFRPLLSINGQFPGPMIECNEGDTIVIDVDNQSVNATSIHFHGIFQNGTNWMDGAVGVTQCPIAPKRNFRYEFTITGQSGTYFYHGHFAVQAADGLFGPLVVHARDEKKLQQIPYTTDRVMMLQDYYHDLSSGVLISALEPGSETPPIPDGALINGLNIRDCSSLPQRLCDNSTAELPSFNLEPNASHRLRLLNVGSLAWFKVAIDDHLLAVTEADGTDLIPSFQRSLDISPAQRYSVIITTNQTTTTSFWLRAKMLVHCWDDVVPPSAESTEIKAIINYSSSSTMPSPTQPSSQDWIQTWDVPCRDMPTSSLIPVSPSPFPQAAGHSYYIRSNLEIGSWRLMRGFFNTSSFRPNIQSPTLHRTIDGFASKNSTFISTVDIDGPNIISYDESNDWVIQHADIKVVDLIIQNFDEGSHPLHLHGHKFWILGQSHGPFPGYSSLGLAPEGKGLLPPTSPDHKSPGTMNELLQRDVASVEGYGWIALRFIADNPGVWAFHCHVAWHSEGGLAMQFLDRVDVVRGWEVPEGNKRLCEVDVRELERGKTPGDEVWFGAGIGR